MKKLLARKKDGQQWRIFENELKPGIPFKGSHIVEFKEDVTTYRYAYDDVEEMCREAEEICNLCDRDVIFKIENNKIEKIEVVEFSELKEKYYANWYILFNGLITVEEYLQGIEEEEEDD